jgi:type IV secretory pathway ATPase VirB11/archaellum biosynthesis ATPase
MQKNRFNADDDTFLPNISQMEIFSKLIEQYTIGPYQIRIYERAGRYTSEALYTYSTMAEISPFGEVIESVAEQLSGTITAADGGEDTNENALDSRFYSLQELFNTRKVLVEEYIEQQYPEFISMKKLDELVELACYKLIGIYKIAPFLMDEHIEEFYLDCPNTQLYLDHRKWGRCKTAVTLSKGDLERIKTRLRYESGLLLDESNPSIKTELITDRFHVRTSMDIFPLAADGLHLDVRKLKRKAFTLPELVANDTLPAEIAAYLYFALLRRRNITVIGEPNSGKTTLVNALDLITPPEWRKITIEDVIESVPQHHYDKHQVRLQVIPFEGESSSRSKGKEIVKLLHRSPDYVFLGEIQTQEHSQAVFHALTAGLHLIQTCHAASPENLIVRWVEHHGIAPINLLTLDLIVFMRSYYREKVIRKVRRVSEVENPYLMGRERLHELELKLTSIALNDSFNVDTSLAKTVTELFDTPTMRAIRIVEGLSLGDFIEEFGCYLELFNYLVQNQVFDPAINVKLFHELHAEKLRHHVLHDHIDWSALYHHVIKLVHEV